MNDERILFLQDTMLLIFRYMLTDEQMKKKREETASVA